MSKPFCIMMDSGTAVDQTILDQYAVKGQASGSKSIGDSFTDTYGHQAILRPLYNPEQLAQLLEINPFHARCVDVKARDAAGLGFSIMPDGDKEGTEPARKKLADFIDSNPVILTEILYRHQYDIESVGFGVLEIVRDGYRTDGEPTEINHIPAHTMRRAKDGIRALQQRGNKKRWFRLAGAEHDVDKDTGAIHAAGALSEGQRATEIVWRNAYSPRSDWYGIPDYIPAIGTISADFSRREYNRTFFENYGIPSYAVFITGNFDPGEIDDTGKTEIQREIETHFQKIAKTPHTNLILALPTMGDRENKIEVKFEKLAVETKEASFRLFRTDNRDEIIVAHGVPPYRIGVMSAGALAGNMAREATKIYKTSVLEPRQTLLETVLNRAVRDGLKVEGWKIELAEIDLEDEKEELDLQKTLHEIGAMTSAEIRSHWADRMGIDPDMPEDTLDLGLKVLKDLKAQIQAATKDSLHAKTD